MTPAPAQQLPALRVLIYSVYETETPHPFVVLVLPEVSQAARQELAQIAEDVIPVQQLAYPYDGKVKFELGINKQCRYSKLHLWAQTQFRSLIYLDVDTAVQKVSQNVPRHGRRSSSGLILRPQDPGAKLIKFPPLAQNIDHLFSTNTNFAGVRDLGDVTNTGGLSPILSLLPSRPHFSLTHVISLSYSPRAQAQRSHVPRHDGHVPDGAELQPRRPGLPELVLLKSDPDRRQVLASGLQRSAEAQGAISPNARCLDEVLTIFFYRALRSGRSLSRMPSCTISRPRPSRQLRSSDLA